ncbi:hypothetical protein D3C73_1006070 [compost metagenome]
MVGQLGQGLGGCDANADRDTGAAQNLAANPSTQYVQAFDTGQVGKRLIDAVDLDRRHHRLDQRHHPLAHVAIQGIVRREGDDALLAELVLDLEIRLAHFHEGLGVVAARDDAAIVVRQDDDRNLGQVRAKHPLATCVKTVAVDKTEDRRWLRHGCAHCR